jgi:hypothetical protein
MGDMGYDFAAMKAHTQARHAEWKQKNTETLTFSGLDFVATNGGETFLFREPGKPKVDFYPSTGRWRIVGATRKTFKGGARSFLNWYAKQATQ